MGQWILALNVFDKAVSLDKASPRKKVQQISVVTVFVKGLVKLALCVIPCQARASTLSFMLTACRTGAQWELALQLLPATQHEARRMLILGLAARAGNAAAKHLARVACQDANSEPNKTPRCS